MTNLNLRQTNTLKGSFSKNILTTNEMFSEQRFVILVMFVGICLLQPNNNLGCKAKVLTMSPMDTLYSLIKDYPTLIFKCH